MKTTRRAQLDYCPIMARPTASLRLPTIAHICGVAGHDQIMSMSEEHIAAREHHSAIFDGGKVNVAAYLPQAIPLR